MNQALMIVDTSRVLKKSKQGCSPHENGDLNLLILQDSRFRGKSNMWPKNDFFITLLEPQMHTNEHEFSEVLLSFI